MPVSRKRLIVHGGMHKTGSTAIQNTLFEQRETLLDAGILYPRAGLHLGSPQAGHRHRGLQRSLEQEGPAGLAVRELKTEVLETNPDVVIVSYEGMFGPDLDPALLRAAFDQFDITVVAYLRNPVDYVESKYREWVRLVGYSGEISDFLKWQAPWLDLSTLIARWRAVFGESLIIRAYEQRDGGSHMTTEILALADAEELVLPATEITNVSTDNGWYLTKLMATKSRHAGQPIAPAVIDRVASLHPTSGRLLTDSQVERLQADARPGFETALASSEAQINADEEKWVAEPVDVLFHDHAHRTEVVAALRTADVRHREENSRKRRAAVQESKRVRTEMQRDRKRLREVEDRVEELTNAVSDLEQELAEATARESDLRRRLTVAGDRADRLERQRAAMRFWEPGNWGLYVRKIRSLMIKLRQ